MERVDTGVFKRTLDRLNSAMEELEWLKGRLEEPNPEAVWGDGEAGVAARATSLLGELSMAIMLLSAAQNDLISEIKWHTYRASLVR